MGEMSMVNMGRSGHLSIFTLLKHLMMLLKYNFFSGLNFYTLPKTLIAFTTMQLRFFLMCVSNWHFYTLKALFNIVEEQFLKMVELWCQCCIMMFRKVNKQPGMQKFWNWCSHYQEIYDWISPLNKRAGSAFILTQ